jgi:hypothetical protein
MSMTISPVKKVTIENASAGSAVKGFLSFSGQNVMVETSRGMYDMIAGSPQVKNELKKLKGVGHKIVSMHGSPYKREDGTVGYLTTSLTIVADTKNVTKFTKKGDKYFGLVGNKYLQLKGMTKFATERLAATFSMLPCTVVGAKNGDVFEVWSVITPLHHRGPQPV